MRDTADDKERAAAAAALRKKYADIGMPGTARLIDFLGSKHARGLLEFGSSSIGPSGNGRLYIGHPKADPPVTPLEDMERQFAGVETLSPEKRALIDQVLGSLGESMWRVKRLRNRIPNGFRHWAIGVFRKFGWPVSEDMSFGSRWWWVPFYHKLKRRSELRRAGLL